MIQIKLIVVSVFIAVFAVDVGAQTNCDYSVVPLGTIWPYAGTTVPPCWILCDGRSLSKTDYSELYAAIGDTYQTPSLTDSTKFQIPDLRGRTLIGAGRGANGGSLTSRTMGQYLGVEKHTLTIEEMPSHNHAVTDPGHIHAVPGYASSGSTYSTFSKSNSASYSNLNANSAKTGITIQNQGSSQSHENMPPSTVVNYMIRGAQTLVTTTPKATTTTPAASVKPWPQPSHLIGYWPLNDYYTYHDISNSKFHGSSSVAVNGATGPFGDANTARSPRSSNNLALEVVNNKLLVEESFTVSLFFKHGGHTTNGGGIFEFIDAQGSTKAFQVRYVNRTTIEVAGYNSVIGQYTILQQTGAWTYLAFVFDSKTITLTVYSRHGVFQPAQQSPYTLTSNPFNTGGIRLGRATKWGSQGLQTSDAVSCLSIYKTALTSNEIKQLIDSCRILHGSAPCGAPKLPLAPIPTTTSITTIAKAGQFPFVASLRFGSMHACSATILDSFWLLTSASCFVESTTVANYKVVVGEYDTNVTESYSRTHSVAKFIFSGSVGQNRELALIALLDPIDFTNQYVNDACLYQSENLADLKIDQTQFVFGWGANGRQTVISQTLGRYVPGMWLTESQCKQAWSAQDFDASKDFCFLSASSDKNVPCRGDEGSPLLLQAHSQADKGLGERLVQVGIYYKRDTGCTVQKPGLFTNIDVYKQWIAEKMACAVPSVSYPDVCPQ